MTDMNTFKTVAKILTALAAVAGAVYLIATRLSANNLHVCLSITACSAKMKLKMFRKFLPAILT